MLHWRCYQPSVRPFQERNLPVTVADKSVICNIVIKKWQYNVKSFFSSLKREKQFNSPIWGIQWNSMPLILLVMRTRASRIEFWKRRLAISATHSSLLLFLSLFSKDLVLHSFFCQYPALFPPHFFFTLPSPLSCWTLETGNKVRACFCWHYLTF